MSISLIPHGCYPKTILLPLVLQVFIFLNSYNNRHVVESIKTSSTTSTTFHHVTRVGWIGQHHHQQQEQQQQNQPPFELIHRINRGGDSTPTTDVTKEDVVTTDTTTTTPTNENTNEEEEEEDLEDRVHAAMKRLGLVPPTDDESTSSTPSSTTTTTTTATTTTNDSVECKDGVCTLPSTTTSSTTPSTSPPVTVTTTVTATAASEEDIGTATKRISKEMNVEENIALAAIGATITKQMDKNGNEVEIMNEAAAKELIQAEKDAIANISEDCDEVNQLVSEGHDKSLARRALAFGDMNMEVARAILQADEEDAKAEEEATAAAIAEQERLEAEAAAAAKKAQEEEEAAAVPAMKTVNVDANFDPTNPMGMGASSSSSSSPTAGLPGFGQQSQQSQQQTPPPPAKKEDVVFQATSETLQQLILESPVPVLLDVYADWCGPCKALTPALEQMAIKAGGMFRLVKLNTDEERSVSTSLEVQSLPTIFGIRDGRIVHSFKGMPQNEDFMKNFMMGLFGADDFKPPVTDEENAKYAELTNKLIKVAGASSFTFSQREQLSLRTSNKLDSLVEAYDGDMVEAEESAKVLRSLVSNVIKDPFNLKFRRVNLDNKTIKKRIASHPPAVAILKSVGFTTEEGGPQNALILGKGKKIVNVSPLSVVSGTITTWIDQNRRDIASALRKKLDEAARSELLANAEEVEEEEEEEDDEVDDNVCMLKVRIDGKKKVHEVTLEADDPLSAVIDALPVSVPEDEEVQITCAARRLIVKSSDNVAMEKSLQQYKLVPSAVLVVQIGKRNQNASSSRLKERAAARKAKKGGEHTMQSIGIYSKDDNAKGELIDGGGGVWYEQDVTDDEEEPQKEAKEEESEEVEDGEE